MPKFIDWGRKIMRFNFKVKVQRNEAGRKFVKLPKFGRQHTDFSGSDFAFKRAWRRADESAWVDWRALSGGVLFLDAPPSGVRVDNPGGFFTNIEVSL